MAKLSKVWFCSVVPDKKELHKVSPLPFLKYTIFTEKVPFSNAFITSPYYEYQLVESLPSDTWSLKRVTLQGHNEWMNEWMNVHLYTAHITWCLMAVYNAIEWDRTSACEGASGCRYKSIFDLTHPPSPCMKCEIDHHTGNIVPSSFRQVRGFFNVPC